MFSYLKRVIEDTATQSPSTHRFVTVISTISLCIGFIVSTGALIMGVPVSDAVVLGLAGILAALAGGTYTANKISKEPKSKQEE